MPHASMEEIIQTLCRDELMILINDKQDNQGMLFGLAELASADVFTHYHWDRIDICGYHRTTS